jgi:TonB family protein
MFVDERARRPVLSAARPRRFRSASASRRRPAADWLRWASSVVVAAVVVAVLLIVGLWAFGAFDRDEGHHAVDVHILSSSERLDLAKQLGEGDDRRRPVLPPLEDIPPLEIPKRSESGFVQVEVVVDKDGSVIDAEVIRAVPSGVFEDQALEMIRTRGYGPGDAGTRTEIVDFTVEPEGE